MSALVQFADRMLRRYTPDPIVFAIALTFVALVCGTAMTPFSLKETVDIWGGGFWNLLAFTMQMAMILLGGFVVATSQPVEKLLKKISSLAKTPTQAVVITFVAAASAAWLNWGLGLVAGAVLALEMSKNVKGSNFRLLVASAYSGFVFWHGGLSGSIPLLLNSEEQLSKVFLSEPMALSQTLFSGLNITLIFSLLATMVVLYVWLEKNSQGDAPEKPTNLKLLEDRHEDAVSEAHSTMYPSERLEKSVWPIVIVAILGFSFVMMQISEGKFKVGLNQINYILVFLGLLLHGNFRNYLKAVNTGAGKLGPILVQYPFYAGIMAILTGTGLAEIVSQFFVDISNATTFPFFTFLSAGLVNVFVPSGGGQWAIQGPIVVPAAQALGADLTKSVMAVAWGDAWTNLLQPFWALPLLSIAGLKIRDILGYCLISLFVSGAIISLVLLVY